MGTGKPLGGKAYGSIGHLPNSRLGPSDSCVPFGYARICTEKPRDRHDVIIVQEKLDGSCVAAYRRKHEILALTRSGYLARTSKYEQHHLWADWVDENRARFLDVLRDGDRICGEWIAQAHGTIYHNVTEPFYAFDIIDGKERFPFRMFNAVIGNTFQKPTMLWAGPPLRVEDAMNFHRAEGVPCDGIEGVVYRVERYGRVDFLAKYVRPDKQDGKYLPEISGEPAVWNWRPNA